MPAAKARFAKEPARAKRKRVRNDGYATGHFGKWHIGPEDQAKPKLYGIDVISAASGAAKKKNTAGRDAVIYDAAIEFIEQHKDEPFYVFT